MKFGIVQFPGSNDDRDTLYVAREVLGCQGELLWHKDKDLKGSDVVFLPGGFSYGDYLRTGAMAKFSPIMGEVVRHAEKGGLVIGACNGFQILCESGLLPGVLIRNRSLKFISKSIYTRVENTDNPFLSLCKKGEVLRLPIKHGEGCYFAEEDTLKRLNGEGQVLLRYCDPKGNVTPEANPNGALENIAGICNAGKNVFGLMPHPEHATEKVLGREDARKIFDSVLRSA
ncbi:MAG: phosphoribosylformylglycinamidine synthase subunit PurQ, partial [Bdellovibrionota bacterium]